MKAEEINWSNPNENEDYDLCGKFRGKYVDVVRHVNGTWSWFYDGNRHESGILTREDAKQRVGKFCRQA